MAAAALKWSEKQAGEPVASQKPDETKSRGGQAVEKKDGYQEEHDASPAESNGR